jgi:hypothetical protein
MLAPYKTQLPGSFLSPYRAAAFDYHCRMKQFFVILFKENDWLRLLPVSRPGQSANSPSNL